MFVKNVLDFAEFLAGDGTHLRELVNQRNSKVEGFSLAHGLLLPGENSKRHKLQCTEVYYFLSGRAIMHVGEESSPVKEGDVLIVPPGRVQWIENTGERIEFLCIVSPPWRGECEEVLE